MTMREDVQRGAELVAGAAVAATLTIVAMIVAGRGMGPAEYADFSASLAVIYLVTLALSPVIPTVARVATRYAAKDDLAAIATLRHAMIRTALKWTALAAVVAAALAWPLAQWLRFRSIAPVGLALLTALAYVVLSIDRGFLQGLFRFREYNLNTLIESGIRAAIVFAFLRRMPTAGFAMCAWTAGTVAALLAVSFTLGRDLRRDSGEVPRWSDFLEMIRPMIVLMMALAVFQNTDLIAVKRWLTPELAGAYGAASALTRGFGALFVPLYALAGPLLTRTHERRESVFGPAMRLTAGYLAIVAIPLIAIVIAPRAIVVALYGPQYAMAAAVLAPLCVITMMSYIALMLTQALITIGDYRFVPVYAAAALAQIAGLAFFHATFNQVLIVLACAQGAALLLVTIIFLKSQYTTRAGSISSSA